MREIAISLGAAILVYLLCIVVLGSSFHFPSYAFGLAAMVAATGARLL